MNILWLSHNVPYPPVRGVLARNYHLIKEAARKNSIYLLALNQKALLSTERQLAQSRDVLQGICKSVDIMDIPTDLSVVFRWMLIICNLFSPTPYASKRYYSKEMRRLIKALLSHIEIDMVHFDTIGLAVYRSEIKGRRAILNHHNIESDLMRRRAFNEKNLLKKFYFLCESRKLRKYEKRMALRFDSNLTVSPLDRERLTRIQPLSRIEIIENGVDTEYFSPGIDREPDEKSLLFVGSMDAPTNADAVLYFFDRIWPLLTRKLHGIRITIGGRNPPKKIVRIAKSDKNVEVLGFVPDTRPLFRKATVYVCPMRFGGGTRLKILDALAMGKATVSTTIGAEGINVEDGRSILIADDTETFAECVIALLTDNNLRARLEIAGRKVAEQYDWRAVGLRLNAVYRSCVGRATFNTPKRKAAN